MKTRLLNVRLDEERIRKAQALRERGVSLSEVVRTAIDERFSSLGPLDFQLDAKQLVRELFERHPDPPDLPARDYDVHDRRAARAAIEARLRRTRS